jgi:hypothetical protein
VRVGHAPVQWRPQRYWRYTKYEKIFDAVEFESEVERRFAADLDANEHEKLFVKTGSTASGFLGNCYCAQKLARCRELLGMAPAGQAPDPPPDYRDRFEALTGRSLRECPYCHTAIRAPSLPVCGRPTRHLFACWSHTRCQRP